MKRFTGVSLILVSATSFGTLAILGRFAYRQGMDTFTLLALRFCIAALLMGALMWQRGAGLPRGRTLLQLVGMGALGYVGQSFFYFTAIRFASAGLVALLLYLYPAFVALLSALFLQERFTPLKLGALLMATIGAALTARPQGGGWTGILLALAAAIIYSVYIVVGARVLRRVSAVQSSTVIFASAGLVYAALALVNGPHMPVSEAGWLTVAGLVVIATVIPVMAFLAGLKRIGPTNASMLSTIEPVVTVLLAAFFFKEALPGLALIGGSMILAAVLILTRSEMDPQPLHEETTGSPG